MSSESSAVRVIGIWNAKESKVGEVRDLLANLAAATKREPACRQFEVWQSRTAPTQFVLIEEFADAEGVDAHRRTEHYAELVLQASPPLVESRGGSVYEAISDQGAAK